jgi:excisionase family DNA binding protein
MSQIDSALRDRRPDHSVQARLERIERLLKELRDAASKPLDLSEAAAYLHDSKSHVYQLTSKGLIAHYKPAGKKIYFLKADLDSYLLRNRRAAANEVEEAAASHIVNNPVGVLKRA